MAVFDFPNGTWKEVMQEAGVPPALAHSRRFGAATICERNNTTRIAPQT